MNLNPPIILNPDLIEKFCNTHSKRTRSNSIQHNIFKQTVYNMAETLDKDFNCTPLFITVTFPVQAEQRDLKREWFMVADFIPQLKKRISQDHLIVGGIISVEPHKNTSLKNQKGKNTKAGAPHFHMVLWVCHKFLNPEIQKLSQYLSEAGTYTKISVLNSYTDTMKAVLYTTKEKGDPAIKYITKTVFSWEQGINVWINHKETKHVFEKIAQSLNNVEKKDFCFTSNELYINFPTCKKFNDNGLLLAAIFSKVFAQKGLAVKDGNVYKKLEGTHFSWEKWVPLDAWVTQRFSFDHNAKFLQMLKDNASWIYNQGVRKKNDVPFNLFPKLSILNFLVEFKDKLFEFSRGTTLPFQQVAPQTATVCFVNEEFDQCIPPYNTLGLLHCLVAWGEDITGEFERIARKDTNELDRYDKGRFHHMQQSQKRFAEALETFGGLFHPTHNRKQNKALYLMGPPSTYKTFLIRTLFNRLIGLDSVDVLDRNSSRFNTSNLRKEGNQPYVLIIDDLRWEHLGMHLPDFINLLDGYFVRTEKKFKQPQSGELKGVVAITSNEYIGGDPSNVNRIGGSDLTALQTRIQSVELFNLRIKEEFVFNKIFLDQIEREAVGFSILTNAAYLAKNEIIKQNIQLPKSFYLYDKIINKNDNLFEIAGKKHMKQFLKELHKTKEEKDTELDENQREEKKRV